MKPRAQGFTNDYSHKWMAAILITHCERNLGRVQKPVWTGDPSFSLEPERKVCLIIYANAVNEIKAIVLPICFADFI